MKVKRGYPSKRSLKHIVRYIGGFKWRTLVAWKLEPYNKVPWWLLMKNIQTGSEIIVTRTWNKQDIRNPSVNSEAFTHNLYLHALKHFLWIGKWKPHRSNPLESSIWQFCLFLCFQKLLQSRFFLRHMSRSFCHEREPFFFFGYHVLMVSL